MSSNRAPLHERVDWTATTVYWAPPKVAWQRLRDLHLRSLGEDKGLASAAVAEMTPDDAFLAYSNSAISVMAQMAVATPNHVSAITQSLCDFAADAASLDGLEGLFVAGLNYALVENDTDALSAAAIAAASAGFPDGLSGGVNQLPLLDRANGSLTFADYESMSHGVEPLVSGFAHAEAGSLAELKAAAYSDVSEWISAASTAVPGFDGTAFQSGVSGLFEGSGEPIPQSGEDMLTVGSGNEVSAPGATTSSPSSGAQFRETVKDFAAAGAAVGAAAGALGALAVMGPPAIMAAGAAAPGAVAGPGIPIEIGIFGAVATATVAAGTVGGVLGAVAGGSLGITVATASSVAGWVKDAVVDHGGPSGVLAGSPPPGSGPPSGDPPSSGGEDHPSGERKTLKPTPGGSGLPVGDEGGGDDGGVDGGLFGVQTMMPIGPHSSVYGDMVTRDVLQLITIPSVDDDGTLTVGADYYAQAMSDLAIQVDAELTAAESSTASVETSDGHESTPVGDETGVAKVQPPIEATQRRHIPTAKNLVSYTFGPHGRVIRLPH